MKVNDSAVNKDQDETVTENQNQDLLKYNDDRINADKELKDYLLNITKVDYVTVKEYKDIN